jgi:toxin ParE1/3/4
VSRRLVFRSRAKRDLISILGHVTRQSGSHEIARAFVERLRTRCRKLARLPGTLGRPRPELGEGVRSLPAGEFVIFFRYQLETIVVVAVVSRHRDIERAFKPLSGHE